MARSLRSSLFTLSLFLGTAACGGLTAIDPVTPEAPAAGSPRTPPDLPPGTAAPAPPPPELALPADTLVIDGAIAARALLPATSRARATRCERWVGDQIVADQDEQGAYVVTAEGHRRLGGGILVGSQHFNRLLGVVGDTLFVHTYSGTNDRRYGVVALDTRTSAASEVTPLRGGIESLASTVRHDDALYSVEGPSLVRIRIGGLETVATGVPSYARLLSTQAGLLVVGEGKVLRLTPAGTLGTLVTSPGTASVFTADRPAVDAHANGAVYWAAGKELHRSDRAAPIVVAPGPITSVRIDTVTGAVAFAVRRAAPAHSSLYLLDSAGVSHVAETREHLTQGQEHPINVLGAAGGVISFTTTCSNDEDAPADMPVRVDANTGALTYLVDDPKYPYVSETGLMLDADAPFSDRPWQDDARGLRFFVRR